MMKNHLTLIAASVVLTLASCQKSAPEQPTTTTAPAAAAATATTATQPALPPPAAATEEIGHYAENLYDWGRTGDWTKAQSDLTSLKSAVATLKNAGAINDLHGADELAATIERAVQARQPRAPLHAANEVTR